MQLAATQPDGSTLRDHLQVAAQHGTTDARLGSTPPPAGAMLYDLFVQLNAARPVGMGPGAIPPSELLAWQQLMGVRLSPWEADTLLAMDRAALAAHVKAARKGS